VLGAIVGVLVALVIDTPRVLFVLAALYAISGPALWAFNKLTRRGVPEAVRE